LVGLTAGFGLDTLAQVETQRAATCIAGAASLAGLWTGVRLTRDYDRERPVN
jgi:hypothetical protein